MTDLFVVPLTTVGRADRERVGGKAAHLGEMLRAGLPVPAGFCLTAAAYQAMVARPGLAEAIAVALEGLDAADLDALQGAADAVRAAWRAAPLPDSLASALDEAYRELVAPEAGGPVAVRSSATVEDQAWASFAGQGETFLNVSGIEALHTAVRDCWASFWSPQALAYRSRHPQAGGAPGVVVQCMVAPEAAGVLFTADPMTGEPDRVVIEAVPGLGEALVQGATTPERYVLSRTDLSVRQWTAAPGRAGAILPIPQAQELARLGLRTEAVFGAPQDVEWAVVAGAAVLLQSRPVTTSADPAPIAAAGRLLPRRMAQVAERFPEPPTPFDVSALVESVYNSVGTVPRGVLRALPFVEQDGVVQDFDPSWRFAVGLLPRLLTVLGVSIRYQAEGWVLQEVPKLDRAFAALASVDVATLRDEEVVAHIRAVAAALEDGFRERWRYVAASLRPAGALATMVRTVEGRDAAVTLHHLMGGVRTVTAAINATLEGLAAQVRATPSLAALFRDEEPRSVAQRLAQEQDDPAIAAFQRSFQDFLQRYGSRETGGPGAANPSWGDDPAIVLAALASLAQGGGSRHAPDAMAAAVAAQERSQQRIPGRMLRDRFLTALSQAREAYRMREDSHFYLMRFVPLLRRGALELGRRWTARGLLQHPDDIFLIRLEEMETVIAGELAAGPLVERRARLMAQARLRWRSYSVAAAQAAGRTGSVYQGIGASRGTVTGRTRILRQERDFHLLRPGEILVGPFTSPSWTPLFAVAGGVVAETGGTLSHAAIVAREYGIPAVVALAGATHLFRDGDLVIVDGAAGTVQREDAGGAFGLSHEEEGQGEAGGGRRAFRWFAGSAAVVGLTAFLFRRTRR